MYFIFELGFYVPKRYISEIIADYAEEVGIEIVLKQDHEKILFACKKEDEKLESFLAGLESVLPASLFLRESKHYFADEIPQIEEISQTPLPHNIAPCPTCQKEMFDVSSRRYYYPFTSCNACGSQHLFVTGYPFKRENSLMKFFVPCQACKEEAKRNRFRIDQALISCIDCGIALRMQDKKSERFANTKGEYRKLFEVAARAIDKGKTVLMKTQYGYRRYFQAEAGSLTPDTILLFCDANALNTHLMMVPQEFHALLSIERPLLRVATKSDELKTLFGSSVLVKYADEGMSMLLAKELMTCGYTYVAYEESDGSEDADFLVDFDLPITPQKDTRLFINQDTKLFISGERILFPMIAQNPKGIVSIAHDLAAVQVEGETIIDSLDHFDRVDTHEVRLLEGEAFEGGHSNTIFFPQWRASMMSVIAERGLAGQKSIGVHFDGQLHFLYYNGKEVINVVPPIPFEADHLWEKIAALREGSDRLVVNFRQKHPDIYERLDLLQGDVDVFKVVAIILGLKNESLEGISAEALKFLGKGGLQVDTRVQDNRFDNYAFIASIISYKLADVPNDLLCYSMYESFGDYIGEIVPQIIEKVGTKTVILTGETFANQSLYGRIQRTLGIYNPLMNQTLPIGKENAVFGALYL